MYPAQPCHTAKGQGPFVPVVRAFNFPEGSIKLYDYDWLWAGQTAGRSVTDSVESRQTRVSFFDKRVCRL